MMGMKAYAVYLLKQCHVRFLRCEFSIVLIFHPIYNVPFLAESESLPGVLILRPNFGAEHFSMTKMLLLPNSRDMCKSFKSFETQSVSFCVLISQ